MRKFLKYLLVFTAGIIVMAIAGNPSPSPFLKLAVRNWSQSGTAQAATTTVQVAEVTFRRVPITGPDGNPLLDITGQPLMFLQTGSQVLFVFHADPVRLTLSNDTNIIGQHGRVTWIQLGEEETITIFPGHVEDQGGVPVLPSWIPTAAAFVVSNPTAAVIGSEEIHGKMIGGKFVAGTYVTDLVPAANCLDQEAGALTIKYVVTLTNVNPSDIPLEISQPLYKVAPIATVQE
jgi:hypothetical protein